MNGFVNPAPKRLETIDDLQARAWRTESGCLEWQRGKDAFGYGMATFRGKRAGAHRIAWMLSRGPIPDGYCVLHKCDNPACIDADHLFLGTHADNSADRARKGRAMRGSRHTEAKLSEDQARQVYLRCAVYGERAVDVAFDFGISPSQASRIKLKKHWKCIHENGGASNV